jgi:hypothetical protein
MMIRLAIHHADTGQKNLAFFADYLPLPARRKS